MKKGPVALAIENGYARPYVCNLYFLIQGNGKAYMQDEYIRHLLKEYIEFIENYLNITYN